MTPRMKPKIKTIADDVLDVLGGLCYPTPQHAQITGGQLDRRLYMAVNAVLETLGGEWQRRSKTHVFDVPAQVRVEAAIQTGTFEPVHGDGLDFFATPPELAHTVAWRANLEPGLTVLEPSAGEGALIDACLAVQPDLVIGAIEIHEGRSAKLADKPVTLVVRGSDFLLLAPEAIWDRVVMNPPFSRQRDIDHVRHAFEYLAPGGRLVSIVSASVGFRTDAKTRDFRTWVEANGGTLEPNADGAFKASGTSVRSMLLVLDKHR